MAMIVGGGREASGKQQKRAIERRERRERGKKKKARKKDNYLKVRERQREKAPGRPFLDKGEQTDRRCKSGEGRIRIESEKTVQNRIEAEEEEEKNEKRNSEGNKG